MPPAPDRAVIERLADLPSACRRDGAFSAIKIKASGLPGEAEKGDEPAALAGEVGNEILVTNLVPVQRENFLPVGHQSLSLAQPLGTVDQVVGK